MEREGGKSSRRKERDDERSGGQSGELSWRTARCHCCGRVGLWHDDLGQIMKITLPGITALLWCQLLLLLLLLLELEEDTDVPVSFFFGQGECHAFPRPAHVLLLTCLREDFSRLPVCRSI